MLGEAGAADVPSSSLAEHLDAEMTTTVMPAHENIRKRGSDEPELAGMGTTLHRLGVVDPVTDKYVIGLVGDSRAYRFRDGILEQLTRDDTWVQERVGKGDIAPDAVRKHPLGHLLTQCPGLADPPTPLILHGGVEVGDFYLLCSDGLVGMLEDSEIESILSASGSDQGTTDTGSRVQRYSTRPTRRAGTTTSRRPSFALTSQRTGSSSF
jgi:serine/threonine protein phosphatase PrpC